MPSIDQMFEQLRARGHRCGRDCETPSWPGVLKNSDGQWVVLVDDVAVFHGDADGYVGRECTDLACKKFFKVKPGTGVANARQAFCPYCGRADDPGDFMTKQQIEYGLSIIGNQVMAEAAATAEEARIQYPSARELRPGNEPEDHPQA